MKTLLENDFPAHYGVGRRHSAIELTTSEGLFDLIDASVGYIVPAGDGYVTFRNGGHNLSIIAFENYLNKFAGTKISDGKRRCDFIMTDYDADALVMLCEITSATVNIENLSRPITKEDKNGNEVVVFPEGKYEKAELQLFETLSNIMPVPAIEHYIQQKKRRICLMAYKINPPKGETSVTIDAFTRARIIESKEAGDRGAQISSPQIEAYGFEYRRICHGYPFSL